MIQFLIQLLSTLFGRQKEPKPDFDIELIKKWEGLRLEAYQDTGGVWTIGYGHTKTAKPGMVITLEEAEQLLQSDVGWAKDAVERLVKVPLNHGQKSALVSFVYNIGESAFSNSTLLRFLNRGKYSAAADELMRWTYDNGQFIQGLWNRRQDEMRKFSGNGGQ